MPQRKTHGEKGQAAKAVARDCSERSDGCQVIRSQPMQDAGYEDHRQEQHEPMAFPGREEP